MNFLACRASMGVSLIIDSWYFKYSCNIWKFNSSFSKFDGYFVRVKVFQIFQPSVGITYCSCIIFAIALLRQRKKFRAKAKRMKLPEIAVNSYFEHSFSFKIAIWLFLNIRKSENTIKNNSMPKDHGRVEFKKEELVVFRTNAVCPPMLARKARNFIRIANIFIISCWIVS